MDKFKSLFASWPKVFAPEPVKDYTFKRSFKQSKVIHLKDRNDKLTPLI